MRSYIKLANMASNLVSSYRPFNQEDANVGAIVGGLAGLGIGSLRNKLRNDEDEEKNKWKDRLTYAAALGIPLALLPSVSRYALRAGGPGIREVIARNSIENQSKTGLKPLDAVQEGITRGTVNTIFSDPVLQHARNQTKLSDIGNLIKSQFK